MKIEDVIDPLWEMANLSPRMTGVGYTIFVSPDYTGAHAARVKVCNTRGGVDATDLFSIGLSDLEIVAGHCKLTADELERVKWWIHRNKFVLLDYWKGNIDTGEMVNAIKPITESDVDFDPIL